MSKRILQPAEQAIVEHEIRKEAIDAKIANIEYFTSPIAGHICVMTLHSGYRVQGHSMCSDEADGQALANTDALNKLWELEMYAEAEAKYAARVGGTA